MHSRTRRRLGAAAGLALALAGSTARAEDSCDLCRTGRNQSPVRLTGIVQAPSAPGPLLRHAAETVSVTNNAGKNIMVMMPTGSRNTLTVDGATFTLVEFHFHAPGEHPPGPTADPAPLEAHFVHDRGGALAVIGVPIQVGAQTHPALARLLQVLPEPGAPRELPNFDPSALDFHTRDVLRYSGSLTTGACAEGVSWFFYAPGVPLLTISGPDLARYTARFPPYARDPQALNARVLVRVRPPTRSPVR